MKEQSLQIIQEEKPLTVGEIQKQVGVIQQVLEGVMKKGTHYGTIPGCGRDHVLLKPGAEKIAATFRLAVDPVVEDLSNRDEIRYRVTVRLVSPSGVFVGAGIGEGSTGEEKYKWRKAVCQEEYDAADPDRRRVKWSKGYQNSPAYSANQIRTEPSDLANTVLKMTKKRALVDAVLTATAASDIFAQDLEDLPDEIREELVGSGLNNDSGKPSQPARRSQQQTAQTTRQEGAATDGQIKVLTAKLTGLNVEEAKLLKAFDLKQLSDLPAAKINEALEWIAGEVQ